MKPNKFSAELSVSSGEEASFAPSSLSLDAEQC